VTAEIVDDDDVAGPQCRHQDLLDIGQEALTIDGPVDDAWGLDTIGAKRGQEGEGPPAAMRRLGNQPLASRRAAMGPRHIGFSPGLIDEDQAGRIKPPLILSPLRPPPGDVWTILLAGVQAFF
jgi:hypothetical protein